MVIMTPAQFKQAIEQLRDDLTEDGKVALIYPMALDVIASTPWLITMILAKLE